MVRRRDFLRGSIVAVAGGIAMPSIFVRALDVAAADSGPAAATPGAIDTPAGRTLIIIQMAGGNDGLNTVVPYQDSLYHSARPTLGLKPDEVVVLNDQLGLHQALKDLKPIWDQGRLAIVQGIGYDHPSLSHFQAMDIWQSADPTASRHIGWLSRIVEGAVDSQGHPIGAMALGPSLPPALCCPPVPPTVVNEPASYRLMTDSRYPQISTSREDTLRRLYASYSAPAPYAALLESTAESTATSTIFVQQVVSGYHPAVSYPASPLADGLKLFAALIAGGTGLRIGYILLGSFDTHADQRPHQEKLLQTLSTSLAAFYGDLAAQGKADQALVLTWSEFGRRLAENASGGTDHGTAAPIFILGGKVKGGWYGEPPDLKNLDNGNLKFAVDFRSVYATVLEQWLQADSNAVLGARFNTLPLVG